MTEVCTQHSQNGRGQKGFTLIELTIVIAIIAILGTLGLPAINDAVQSARLVSTKENIERIGNAWLAKGGGTGGESNFFVTGTRLDLSIYSQQVTATQLEQFLEIEVPEIDGWGNPIEYRVDSFPSRCLLIRSRNADGQFDADGSYVVGTLLSSTERIRDLVWADRRWIVRPDPWRRIITPIPVPPGPIPNF